MMSVEYDQIYDVLIPHFQTVEERRALLTSAFGIGHMVLNRIDFDGSAIDFFWNLISILESFGEVQPGRSAIQALLESIRDRVGIDHKATIELFIRKLRSSVRTQPDSVFVGFAPDDAELASRIVTGLSNSLTNIAVLSREDMVWEGDESIYCAVVIFSTLSKALAVKEVKKLIANKKRIVIVLAPGTDPSIIPVSLDGIPILPLNKELDEMIIELQNLVGELIDTVRGLKREWWDILVRKIESYDCVPIVGPDMYDEPSKTEREIASEWSTRFGYALGGNDEVSRVAQYLTYMKPEGFDVKHDFSVQRLYGTHPKFLDDEANHYRTLANLPFKLYLNTASDGFLYEALRVCGKVPEEWHFWDENWLEEHRDALETIFSNLTDKTPAIIYLFGHHSKPDSMCLSEDEFLEYLFRIGQNLSRSPSLFPTWLPGLLSNKMLLILGFQLHDWRFRTITHAFADYFKSGGTSLSHLAVQIPPLREYPSDDDEKNAKEYIEKYLSKLNSHVVIGTPTRFLSLLKQKWEAHSL